MLGCDLDGLVEISTLQYVEAGYEVLGFGVRAVGQQHFAVADSDGGGDSGGPYARYMGEHPHPDFAFTQQQSPELAPPGWRPQYVDYLILGLTTSTAFSPTDVLPLSAWAKLTMALQSLISLTVVGLVIARAVNVFS